MDVSRTTQDAVVGTSNKGWFFTSRMMGCHQNMDVLLDDQGTNIHPVFEDKT
jgi:hypothetical protein